jgi:hypothetical protein
MDVVILTSQSNTRKERRASNLSGNTQCTAVTKHQSIWGTLLLEWIRLHKEELYDLISSLRSFATTVSQLKISDFSGETLKGYEVLYFSISATRTHLLSSG